MYHRRGSSSGRFTRLSSNVLYVAGSPHTESLAGSRVRTNFKGCMRKVRYQADSIRLDLTELARREHRLLTVVGDIIFDKCQELVDSQPVSFTIPESYLTIPTWERSSKKGSLAFQFQTVEPGGIMMYSNGDRDGKDFFGLEFLDGHLFLVLDMGGGIHKVKASKLPVTDGNPHDVYFEFTEHKGYISVDGQKESFASSKNSDRFDLHGHLYVGGLGPEINVSSLPRELWAAMLGLSYVGCLQDLVVNGNSVDLMAAARLQNKSDVDGSCKKVGKQCLSHPCSHQGVCVEGWNRFSCDCRATGFVGSVCQKASVTLRFDGTQFMKVTLAKESVTQAEDISLRFRTMHPNGLLFLASAHNGDGMKLYLQKGSLYLAVHIGNGAKILSVGHTLNDDRWHTVFIKRRVHIVELSIDQDRPVIDQIQGSAVSLAIEKILVGHSKTSSTDSQDRSRSQGLQQGDPGGMLNDDSEAGHHSGFVGSMQSFIFNQKHFFEMANSGSSNIEISARFSSDEYVVRDPVTFKSGDGYAFLQTLQAHDKFSITLQLKTTESDGLLLYNEGKEKDFFALELYQGFLYYVYNMGEGTQRVKGNMNQPINDNKWHEVRLLRAETFKQLLRIDDNTPTIDDISGARNTKFDLHGPLYVGGVRKTMYPTLPQLVYARQGFMGCLGSLNLNGYLPNILREAGPIHQSVGDGCKGPFNKCLNDSCSNQGKCVQQWTSYRCDCDMTSYTGPMCNQDSVSYNFGPGDPGLITFTHPEGQRPSTNFENVAFGFKTLQDNAVLIRMDSATNDDFINIELVKGNILVLYNMGTIDLPVGDFYQKVNDGHYHVVRFTRAGPNTTLQIDSNMPQRKNPIGNQAHTFNDQTFVRIGGKKQNNGNIHHPFEGTVSGLVVNGIRVFELAKQEDPRIHFEGKVTLNLQKAVHRHKIISDDEDIEDMQSTQGRRKRMNSMLGRYLQWKKGRIEGRVKLIAKYLHKALSGKSSDRRKVAKKRKFRRHSTRSSFGQKHRQERRFTILEPKKKKYQAVLQFKSGSVRNGFPTSTVDDNHDVFESHKSVHTLKELGIFGEEERKNVHMFLESDNSVDDRGFINRTHHAKETTAVECNFSGPAELRAQPKDEYSNILEKKLENQYADSMGQKSGSPYADNVRKKSESQYANYMGQKSDSQYANYMGQKSENQYANYMGQKSESQYANYMGQKSENQYANYMGQKSDSQYANYRGQKSDSQYGNYIRKKSAVPGNQFNWNKPEPDINLDYPKTEDGYLKSNSESDAEDREEAEENNNLKMDEYLAKLHTDDEDVEEEGSGWEDAHIPANETGWVSHYELLDHGKDTSTIVLPFRPGPQLSWTVVEPTTKVFDSVEWNYFRPHTTPRDGVTDDNIITSGAGSDCDKPNEMELCTEQSSGNEDSIITTTVIISSSHTRTPSTTTTFQQPPKCTGTECENSSKLRQPPNEASTTPAPDSEVKEENGDENYGKSIHDVPDEFLPGASTAEPGKTVEDDDDGGSGINLGLALGIAGSLLVAVIVLCIAFYKLRSRDEGTYKVDETQNFSALQSKKSQGNGTLASGSDGTSGKRGKKKDVKEWYV